nr:ISSpo2 transposase [uncultured bacterium]
MNITTASIGLRPARDLRSASGLRQTRSNVGRNSSLGTMESISTNGSRLASRLAKRSERSKMPEVPRQRGAAATARAGLQPGNLASRGIDLPEAMVDWSLTSLQLKLIKIEARVVRHARAITFQLAEVAVTGPMVRAILAAISRLRAPPLCA